MTELVVHPGVDQKALEREYPAWGFKWQQELAAIKATDVLKPTPNAKSKWLFKF